MIKLITFDWWHYLLIQVWLRWPRIPPGVWTGDTNCSPNTSSFVCSRDYLVCRAVVYCRILQGPRYVFCSARRRGLDYRRTRARTPCDDGDWSQESSEQVLRNTTLTARRELCYRAYTGRLHNSQNVGSQTGAARSFAARQTEQLWNFQNLPKLLHKSPDWHAERLQWREGREKSLR